MPSILFVCTGNQYRSPIAAAYLRRLLKERGLAGWSVESAGTWAAPGQPLASDAGRDAVSLGLDVRGHRTQLVDKALLGRFDLILVMENGHREALRIEFPEARDRVFLLSEMLEGPQFDIADPVRLPDGHYHVLHDMCDVIERGLPRILELAVTPAGGRA